jgi:hypothetical protein
MKPLYVEDIPPGTRLRMRGTVVTILENRGAGTDFFGRRVYRYLASRDDAKGKGIIELGLTETLIPE